MDSPKVTVITPTYNCADYLGETIRSVLGQDYEPLQYIVIDDGSTDGTNDILARLDSFINLTTHAKNRGEQETVNEGLKLVEGDYFMVVNADDPLLPKAISALVDFMENHKNVLVGYPDWNSINEDGTFRSHVKSREYDFTYMVRHHTCLPSVGSIFRKEVIDKIGYRDTAFQWLGDFDYWLRIGLVGDMARVPSTLATWRHRTGQASGNRNDARAREHIGVIDKLFALPLSVTLQTVEGEARCWACLVAASISNGLPVHYIVKALRYYPRLLYSLEFYDTVAKRAYHILRR